MSASTGLKGSLRPWHNTSRTCSINESYCVFFNRSSTKASIVSSGPFLFTKIRSLPSLQRDRMTIACAFSHKRNSLSVRLTSVANFPNVAPIVECAVPAILGFSAYCLLRVFTPPLRVCIWNARGNSGTVPLFQPFCNICSTEVTSSSRYFVPFGASNTFNGSKFLTDCSEGVSINRANCV